MGTFEDVKAKIKTYRIKYYHDRMRRPTYTGEIAPTQKVVESSYKIKMESLLIFNKNGNHSFEVAPVTEPNTN